MRTLTCVEIVEFLEQYVEIVCVIFDTRHIPRWNEIVGAVTLLAMPREEEDCYNLRQLCMGVRARAHLHMSAALRTCMLACRTHGSRIRHECMPCACSRCAALQYVALRCLRACMRARDSQGHQKLVPTSFRSSFAFSSSSCTRSCILR